MTFHLLFDLFSDILHLNVHLASAPLGRADVVLVPLLNTHVGVLVPVEDTRG